MRLMTGRWGIRTFSAGLFFVLTVATAGLVQALSGAGTPCDGCGPRCYEYHAKRTYAQGGCQMPNGQPDFQCLSQKCANWCDGCIDTTEDVIDCENPNCWQDGIMISGGNVCSNGCYGAKCEVGSFGSPDKHCYQEQQPCEPEDTTLGCSRCSCVQ